MDDTNTFVQKIANMMKTDDPMYAAHGGWMYVKYARASEMDEYMMVGGGSLEGSTGCHDCHAKASNDSVFVSLSMPEGDMPSSNGDGADAGDGAGDGTNGAGNGDGAGDGMTGNGADAGDGAGDGTNGAGNANGAGDGANGAGNGAGNGDGAGNGNGDAK